MISIILPAYNCEKTIEESVSSVLAQTYTDWELIIVNDGSTDSTQELCELFAKSDSRVIVFNKENEGVVKARSYALEKAHGDYVAFIDSDDQYSPDMLEKMMIVATINDCDIVACGYYEKYSVGSSSQKVPSTCGEKSTGQFFPMLFETGILGFMWNKIYRKSVLLECEFAFDLNVCEDLYLNCRLLAKPRKVYVLQDCLYYYFMNPGSVTHDISKLIDEHGNWKYLMAYKEIENLFYGNRFFLKTVQASTLWIIKIGIEELSVDEKYNRERSILLKEMVRHLPVCVFSKNSVRFKLGYLRRILLETSHQILYKLKKTEL